MSSSSPTSSQKFWGRDIGGKKDQERRGRAANTGNMSFVGKYERVSADNYEDFLKALDVNFMLRKAATFSAALSAAISTPVMEVSREDSGVWTIKTSTTLKTRELKFKLDEEFEETTPDGRDVKASVTQEGNKFISVQTAKKEGQKSTKVVRVFLDDQVIQTMEVLDTDVDVVYKQIFNKKI